MPIDLTDTPENRPAICVFVMEEVLKWSYCGEVENKFIEELSYPWNSGNFTIGHDFLNPFTNANDDVAVLEHVRANWPVPDQDKFLAMLQKMQSDRSVAQGRTPVAWQLEYESGDYALAACRVVQGRES